LIELIERILIAGAIAELGGLGQYVVGNELRVLEGAAGFKVGGDASGSEGLATDGCGASRRLSLGVLP